MDGILRRIDIRVLHGKIRFSGDTRTTGRFSFGSTKWKTRIALNQLGNERSRSSDASTSNPNALRCIIRKQNKTNERTYIKKKKKENDITPKRVSSTG